MQSTISLLQETFLLKAHLDIPAKIKVATATNGDITPANKAPEL